MLTGACLCGDIAFAIDGAVDGMAHCHCSMCRKLDERLPGFAAAPS